MTPRILSFEPSYPPHVGGGEKLGHRFNAGFVAEGAEVRVITSVPPLHGVRDLDGVRVDYIRAWRFLGFPWFGLGRVRAAVRAERPSFALLYGPSPYDVVAAVVLRALRVPFVAVYLADFDERRWPTRCATALHNAIALRWARGVVCITERMRERLAARGFAARTIVAIPGVDERFFEAPVEAGRGLLFVGGLGDGHRYKRLDLLLEALAFLDPAATLRVVGDGDRRAQFERQAKDLGVDARVTFLGAIGDDDLAREYARAGVLVLPSPTTQEGFGLVCLEAMASGVPVVCSARAGAAATVASAPGCAVWDGDAVADLVRAIERARAATHDERGRLRAYARGFGWPQVVGRLLEAMLQLPGITPAG